MNYLQLGNYRFTYTTNEQGCYLSTLYPNAKGYVQVYVKGKKLYLHRLAYAEKHLFLKARRLTQTCGNRNCINVDHIVQVVNNGARSGSNNPNAKINEQIAREIYFADGTQKQIAEKYNVSVRLVGKIRRGEAWENATKGQ